MFKKIRKVRILAAFVVMGALLAPTTPAVAAPVEITLSCFNDLNLSNLLKEWETVNPNIKVKVKTADFNAHHDGLLTQLIAGSGPDIACVEVGYSSRFKAYPQLFTNLGKTFKANTLEKSFINWRWEQGVARDGTIIGIPTDVGGLAMCYRQDLLKKAGLPNERGAVSAATSTPEKLTAFAKKYVAATGKPFLDNVGSLFEGVSRQGADGVQFYDKKTDKIVEVPQVKKAYDLAATFASQKLSAEIELWSSDWNQGMGNGAFAAMLCPSWLLSNIQNNAKDIPGAWDVAQMPGGGANWGGSQLVIPKFASNPKAAWAFISWVLAPQQQLKLFLDKGVLPTTPAVYTDPKFLAAKDVAWNNAPIGKIYSDVVMAIKKPIYEGKDQVSVKDAYNAAVGRMASGKQTPEASWAQLMKEIKKIKALS
jgi:cellobiose transport system substrate-binding protein